MVIGHRQPDRLVADVATGYSPLRIIAGAVTPSGHSHAVRLRVAGWRRYEKRLEADGGWKFGNTIDGCQAEYVLVPDAMANLGPIPDGLSHEQVLMCPDIISTGFSGPERGKIRIGDTVAIFTQGPIGLCATAGAKLKGATTIIVVDTVPKRLEVARLMGTDITVDFHKVDP